MTYRVEYTTAAARQIKKLPRPTRDRVLDAVEHLADEPRPHGARNLDGEHTAWRIKIGASRVIYDVVDLALTVMVVRAAHRREAYPGAPSGRRALGAAGAGRSGRSDISERIEEILVAEVAR